MKEGTTADPLQRQLRVVQLCYDYVFLQARQKARAVLSSAEQARLQVLLRILRNDSDRRQHRRIALRLPAQVKTERGTLGGLVANLSGSGMFVALPCDLPAGATVQVCLADNAKRYVFPCVVVRQARGGAGLRFQGVPLEIRYGRRDSPPQRAAGGLR